MGLTEKSKMSLSDFQISDKGRVKHLRKYLNLSICTVKMGKIFLLPRIRPHDRKSVRALESLGSEKIQATPVRMTKRMPKENVCGV